MLMQVPMDQAVNHPGGETAGPPCRSLRERLRGLVIEILGTRSSTERFSDDDTLAEIGIASIDMVALLLSVESAFNIEVPQHEITVDVFRSISTIDAMIGRLLPHTLPANTATPDAFGLRG